jgi:hypothetical protein
MSGAGNPRGEHKEPEMFRKIRHQVEPSSEPITKESIALRAYQLWEARGCPEGDGDQDWQQALLQLETAQQRPLSRLWSRFKRRGGRLNRVAT